MKLISREKIKQLRLPLFELFEKENLWHSSLGHGYISRLRKDQTHTENFIFLENAAVRSTSPRLYIFFFQS